MKALANERRIRILMAALVAALMAAVVLSAGTGSEANASSTPQITTCQDNQSCISYPKGGWNKIRSDKASGGTYHVTRSATKPAVYFAAGPEIELVTATGPKRGTAKVVVLDVGTGEKVKVVKFTLKGERSHYKVVKRITGLREDKLYAAAIVSANGNPVVVDAFKSFFPETPPPPPDGVAPPPPPEGVTPPGS